MKKSTYIVGGLLTLLLTLPASANAEGNTEARKSKDLTLTGGPAAEVCLSNFSHSGIDNGKSSMRTGGSIGGFVNLGISAAFSVQGELLFNYKTSHFRWPQHEGSYRYWGMTVPIYALYHFNLSRGARLSIGIGPYTDFGLGACFKANGKSTDLYSWGEETGFPLMKDSDTGFGVKLGYELPCGLQLNAVYRHSISNVIDANSSTVKMLPQVITIGLAYRFGKIMNN